MASLLDQNLCFKKKPRLEKGKDQLSWYEQFTILNLSAESIIQNHPLLSSQKSPCVKAIQL